MAAIIGVTPDIETTKWNLEREFRNPRNWKVTAPFRGRKEALEWERQKAEEMQLKTVKQNLDVKRIRVEWRGFYFEHDGRK